MYTLCGCHTNIAALISSKQLPGVTGVTFGHYLCAFVCVYVCVYCMCLSAYVCCMYVRMFVRAHVCVCVCMCMYVCMFACTVHFTDEGSRRLPKHLNYCFSELASATNQSACTVLVQICGLARTQVSFSQHSC